MARERAATLGPIQAPRQMGIAVWQFDAAIRAGLIPPPDADGGRWSVAVIEEATSRVATIVATVGEQAPIGASRAADHLAERLDLPVAAADVADLADQDHLAPVGVYKDHPLYDVRDLDRLADQQPARIRALVDERQDWIDSSLPLCEVWQRLDWSRRELEQVLVKRDIAPGRFGRLPTPVVDALAGDTDLDRQVRRERLIGPDQAAERLEIRRTDFDYCVAAGWITPVGHADSYISRRRTVTVPLYRIGDVDDLRDIPGVDWEAVRATPAGKPSPLRRYTQLPVARATLVRGLAADLTDQYRITVATSWDEDRDRWTLTWPATEHAPTRAQVRDLITNDEQLAPHSSAILLRTPPEPAPESS